MSRFKAFNEWHLPDDSPSFFEDAESAIQAIEDHTLMKTLFTEISSEDFWDAINDDSFSPNKYQDFENEVESLVIKYYDKMYFIRSNDIESDPGKTDEYNRIYEEVKAVTAKRLKHGTRGIDYSPVFKTALRNALTLNILEKHVLELKAIYQKWINFLHTKRGMLKGKKFGF
jgi:hypothetical protein